MCLRRITVVQLFTSVPEDKANIDEKITDLRTLRCKISVNI